VDIINNANGVPIEKIGEKQGISFDVDPDGRGRP